MATIEKRVQGDGETSYRVKVRIKGRPAETATFNRKTDAVRWAQATESAIREGKSFPSAVAKRRTFAELADKYKRDVLPRKRASSQLTQGLQLAFWKERLGAYALGDILPTMIADIRDELAAGRIRQGDIPRSPTTVSRYLALLSHVFTFGMKELDWINLNPVQRVKKPSPAPGRVRYLSDTERAALLTACKESHNADLHDIVLLGICTGMRKGEIQGLTWNKLDLGKGLVILAPEDTKNATRRIIPLAEPALSVMRERARTRRIDTNLVFATAPRTGQTPRPVQFHHAFQNAVRAAKIQDFRFHDCRHTTASYLAMNGATLSEIGAILGHKTTQMSARYAHLSTEHNMGVLSRMTAAVFGTAGTAKESANE